VKPSVVNFKRRLYIATLPDMLNPEWTNQLLPICYQTKKLVKYHEIYSMLSKWLPKKKSSIDTFQL